MCDFRLGKLCHEEDGKQTFVFSTRSVCIELFRSGPVAMVRVFEYGEERSQAIVDLPLSDDGDLSIFAATKGLEDYGEPHEKRLIVDDWDDLEDATAALMDWFEQEGLNYTPPPMEQLTFYVVLPDGSRGTSF